jgi:hypothetical protein
MEYAGLSPVAFQDQHNDGGCASPSLEASQDWHKTLESMLDEEYVPEEVNPSPKGANPA